MRHRSQATSVFVKQNIERNLLPTIADLRRRLSELPDDKLADHLMRYGTTLRGTRSFWNKSRGELSDMVMQLGSPTLFFTLSAADTKWPDLHNIMPGTPPAEPSQLFSWRINNVVMNPHLASIYMHLRSTIFREEILQKHLHATDSWYEWQHHGSAHIHGFLWIENAPDVDKLDWNDADAISKTKQFFDRYISTWNPHSDF